MNHLSVIGYSVYNGIYKSSKQTNRMKRKRTTGQIGTLPILRLFGTCSLARPPPGWDRGEGRGDACDALHKGRGRL